MSVNKRSNEYKVLARQLFDSIPADSVSYNGTHYWEGSHPEYVSNEALYGIDPYFECKILANVINDYCIDYYIEFKNLIETYISKTGVFSWDVYRDNKLSLQGFILNNHGDDEHILFYNMSYKALRDLILTYSAINYVLDSTTDPVKLAYFNWFLLIYTLPSFHYLRYLNTRNIGEGAAERVKLFNKIEGLVKHDCIKKSLKATQLLATIMVKKEAVINTDNTIESLKIEDAPTPMELKKNRERVYFQQIATGYQPELITANAQ